MNYPQDTDDRHISYYIKDYVEYIRQQCYDYLENTPTHRIRGYDAEVLKEKFDATLKIDYTSSKKYTKIISLNWVFRKPIVHSFILNNDDTRDGKDFKKGDILGIGVFRMPDRNKTFGNVILKNYHATWYKPLDNPNNKP